MKKRILVLLLMGITTFSLVAPFLGEIGVRKVYAKEESSAIYHKHTGSSSSGGGCFSGITYCNGNIISETQSIKCGCRGSIISQTQWLCTAGHVDNNSVGGGWYMYPHDLFCTEIVGTGTIYYCGNCNTNYSYNIGICNAVRGYCLQCNKDETTPIATLACSTNTDDWTTKVVLAANISVLDSSYTLSSTPYIWNGTPSSESTYTVLSNGSYSLELAGSDNTTQGKISVSISNIDSIVPTIQSLSLSTEEVTSNSVTVKVVAADEGDSGLADNPYSYDGGNNWVSSCENSFSNNGNYTVIVRDRAGNSISRDFVISNIVKPSNTGNTASTTTVPNSPPSKPTTSTFAETTTQSSDIAKTSNSNIQINNTKGNKTKITESNTNSNSNNKDKGKNSITKTPDSSVSGNSIRFFPYKREKIDSKDLEESTTVSDNELLATKNAETIETISNNISQQTEDNSLLSILFSRHKIKTIIIVFSGTFLCVFVILFLKKKVHNYHTHPKH